MSKPLRDIKESLPLPRFTGPDGGIGRRAGLKHQWIHFHAGSTPALGTQKIANNRQCRLLAIFILPIFPTFSPHVQKGYDAKDLCFYSA